MEGSEQAEPKTKEAESGDKKEEGGAVEEATPTDSPAEENKEEKKEDEPKEEPASAEGDKPAAAEGTKIDETLGWQAWAGLTRWVRFSGSSGSPEICVHGCTHHTPVWITKLWQKSHEYH